MSTPAQVICVTPVRNEAWILERFLRRAATWADHIIVADQGSDDGSREIARGADRTTLIDNPAASYDEGARQRLLLEAARRIPGRRLVVALDADEALSPNVVSSPEWDDLRRAPEGTVGRFDWVNLLPDLATCWIPARGIPFAYLDDGAPHAGERIHSTRLPAPESARVVDLREVKVLHYQYVAWRRMKSKQRWYQCWEALHHPDKRPIQIYRQYHRMDAFLASEVEPVDRSWLGGEEAGGLSMAVDQEEHYPWDAEVLDWIAEHGPSRFRRLDIWDVDWASAARHFGRPGSATAVDPRTRAERLVHRWLGRTQPHAHRPWTRLAQRGLATTGW